MDDLARLMDKLSESIATLNRLSASLNPPEEDFVETDEDRVVSVESRPDGSLIAIKIANKWEETLEPEELAPRIEQVLAIAQMRAMGLGMGELTGRDAIEAPQIDLEDVEPTAADRAAAQRASAASYEQFVAKVDQAMADEGATLERFYVGLEKLDAALARAEADEPETEERIYSENHNVWAVITPGGLSGFGFKEGWLEKQSATNLNICLAEIVAQLPATEGPALTDVMRQFKA